MIAIRLDRCGSSVVIHRKSGPISTSPLRVSLSRSKTSPSHVSISGVWATEESDEEDADEVRGWSYSLAGLRERREGTEGRSVERDFEVIFANALDKGDD